MCIPSYAIFNMPAEVLVHPFLKGLLKDPDSYLQCEGRDA